MNQQRFEYNAAFFKQEDLNVIKLSAVDFAKIQKLTYKIFRYNEQVFSKEIVPSSKNIEIPFDDLAIGDYKHELIMTYSNRDYIAFLGKLLIIEDNVRKVYCDNATNIVVNTDSNVFNIDIQASGLQGIQGDKGWTPLFTFENDGTERILKKLIDYIGGAGKKPTENIGLYISSSGYTSTKSQALNFKGEKGSSSDMVISSVTPAQISTQLNALADGLYFANGTGVYKFSPAVVMGTIDGVAIANNTVPEGYIITFLKKGTAWSLNSAIKISGNSSGGGSNVITYTHSGNKEVAVSAINYSTNTFTSNAHGLSNGDRVAFNKTIDCNILTHTPFSDGWNVDSNNGGWFVVGVTTNTFQLSLTASGSPIVLTERATNDFTKWKIEVAPTANSFAITNLNATSLKIDIVGATFRNTRYLLNNQSIYSGYRTRNGETTVNALVVSENYSLTSTNTISINVVNGLDYIDVIDNSVKLTSGKLITTRDVVNLLPIRTTSITNIPSISFNIFKPMNGTKIIIEKLA